MATKQIMLGYQQVRIDTPVREVEAGREMLVKFAARKGFSLGAVHIERNVNQPCSALVALIEAARRGRDCGVAAVGVPRAADLGRLKRVQQLMRDRLERECGLPVMVVEWWLP